MKRFIALTLILVFAVLGLASCNMMPTQFRLVESFDPPESYLIAYNNVAWGIDAEGNCYYMDYNDTDGTREFVFLKKDEGGYIAYTKENGMWTVYHNNMEFVSIDHNYYTKWYYTAGKYYAYPLIGTKKQLEDTTMLGRDCLSYEVMKHDNQGKSYTEKTGYKILIDKETGIMMKYEITSFDSPVSNNTSIVGSGSACVEFTVNPQNFGEKFGLSAEA